MRSIVNISLPVDLKKDVEGAVRSGGYATKSEFFRDALRAWKERQILLKLEKSRQDIQYGKGRVLRSLKDLR